MKSWNAQFKIEKYESTGQQNSKQSYDIISQYMDKQGLNCWDISQILCTNV